MSKKERRRRRRSFDRPRRVSGLFCILQLTIGTASLLLSSCFIGIADANVVPSARQGQEGGCQVGGMGSAVGGGEDQFAHSQPTSSCRLHGRSEAHGEPSEGAMVDPGTNDMGPAQNRSNSNKSGEEEAGGRGGKGGDDVEKKPVRRRWKSYICSRKSASYPTLSAPSLPSVSFSLPPYLPTYLPPSLLPYLSHIPFVTLAPIFIQFTTPSLAFSFVRLAYSRPD